ncbi:phage tail sheath subtilisin-like domain-containing protein [Streptomyces sp. NPDC007205]|uniref:phage tail sheath family protein n=1 Tax=Streptomyces sp. NPDC007205 TaxID=3154316 RepID=UPI0033FA10CB
MSHQLLNEPPVIPHLRASVTAFVGDAPGLPPEPAFVRHPRELSGTVPPGSTCENAPSFVRDAVLGHFRNGGGGVWIVGTAPDADRVAAYRSALAELAPIAEITLVVAPDLWRVEADAHGIAQAVAEHCGHLGDRVALLHTRQGLAPAEVTGRPFRLAEPAARFAAVYYPWIVVTDADGTQRPVPPSGHVSGLCCRLEAEQGVHTAPTSALLTVLEHERELSDAEQAALGDLGVNCLRFFPGEGTRVVGARTLSTEPDWMQLSVRRLVNHARAALGQGIRRAASEPADAPVRTRVHRSATAFLTDLWHRGALHGRSADEAFRVVCDAGDSTSGDTVHGMVTLDVGLAVVRPAEFIYFRIQQPVGL